jgi:hypothetical protein
MTGRNQSRRRATADIVRPSAELSFVCSALARFIVKLRRESLIKRQLSRFIFGAELQNRSTCL